MPFALIPTWASSCSTNGRSHPPGLATSTPQPSVPELPVEARVKAASFAPSPVKSRQMSREIPKKPSPSRSRRVSSRCAVAREQPGGGRVASEVARIGSAAWGRVACSAPSALKRRTSPLRRRAGEARRRSRQQVASSFQVDARPCAAPLEPSSYRLPRSERRSAPACRELADPLWRRRALAKLATRLLGRHRLESLGRRASVARARLRHKRPRWAAGPGGLGTAIIVSLWSAIDAYGRTERINRRAPSWEENRAQIPTAGFIGAVAVALMVGAIASGLLGSTARALGDEVRCSTNAYGEVLCE